MFYDKFVALCAQKDKFPTQVAAEIGFSTGNITHWKNGAQPHALKVPPAAARLIKEKIAAGEERLVDCNPDNLYNRFVRMVDRLDLPHHVRFHDLRHFFASEMAALGIPKRYAKDLMGHADGKMLDRVYEHTIGEYMDRFEDQIAEHFGKLDTK